MSILDATNLEMGNDEKQSEKVMAGDRDVSIDRPLSEDRLDLLAKQSADTALDAKMHIVNNVSKNSLHATFPPLLWASRQSTR